MNQLTIGQAAHAAGVNVETIRYYQRRGLLLEPEKPLGGHRRYCGNDVHRVRFIKRAQVLGFTLEEINNLLHLEEAHCCADTRALAVHKLQLIDAKLADLTAMRSGLAGLVKRCDSGNQDGECPIIHALVQD